MDSIHFGGQSSHLFTFHFGVEFFFFSLSLFLAVVICVFDVKHELSEAHGMASSFDVHHAICFCLVFSHATESPVWHAQWAIRVSIIHSKTNNIRILYTWTVLIQLQLQNYDQITVFRVYFPQIIVQR